MRFTPPWSSKPKSWEGFVPKTALPEAGSPSPCQAPVHGTPPVVHRFHDLFLLKNAPVNINTQELYQWGRRKNPCTPCPETYCERPWEIKIQDGLRWGIFVISEQAWYWQGTSLGELIESISLTPQEELEIQIFTWDRTKLSRDFESTDLVDKKSEISLTTHDSSQVINRMEKEKQWEFGANVGFEYGVTAGAELSAGESTRDATERQSEHRQELTSKTAQQVRSERRVKISTVRETGTEERTRRLLKNSNPTRSVTYNFYETLSHYKVDIAPVELQLVVAIPNELPEITPCWVVCHEGILRKHLLDETQETGFEGARQLIQPQKYNFLAEAARRLYEAFIAQPQRTDVTPERQLFLEREARLRDDGPLASTEMPTAWEYQDQLETTLSSILEEYPPSKGSTFLYTREFLALVRDQPTVAGLKQALWLIRGWLLEKKTSSSRSFFYPVTPELETAIGFACAVLTTNTGGARFGPGPYPTPGMTGGMYPETEEVEPLPEQTPRSLVDESQEREAQEARAAAKAPFDALKCHIEENILYYMRYIWLAEDPGVRRRYLSQRLGDSGMKVLDSLIEEPLLGFHLNCSVFAVKLTLQEEEQLLDAFSSGQAPANFTLKSTQEFASQVRTYGNELKEIVGNHYQQLVDRRFQADGSRILNQIIAQAVQHVLTCEKPGNTLTPELLPQVLVQADTRLKTAIDLTQRESNYLNEDEKQQKAAMLMQADALAGTKVIAEEQNAVIKQLVSVGQWAVEHATPRENINPMMVSLPDGGYHCEPVVGNCSGVEELRKRELEAEVALRELEVERRKKRLEANNLEPEPPMPTLNIKMDA